MKRILLILIALAVLLSACQTQPAETVPEESEYTYCADESEVIYTSLSIEQPEYPEEYPYDYEEVITPSYEGLPYIRFGEYLFIMDLGMDLEERASPWGADFTFFSVSGLNLNVYNMGDYYVMRIVPRDRAIHRGANVSSERGIVAWFDERVAVIFDLIAQEFVPIAFEIPEQYTIFSLDASWHGDIFALVFSVEQPNGNPRYYMQVQTWDGRLIANRRLQDGFQRISSWVGFDEDMAVYDTTYGFYRIDFTTGENRRLPGELSTMLPGGWIISSERVADTEPGDPDSVAFILLDENDEQYGEPVIPMIDDIFNWPWGSQFLLIQPEAVFWQESAGDRRIVTLTNGVLYVHMNFETGTFTHEHIYTEEMLEFLITSSSDGRFEVHGANHIGLPGGGFFSVVLRDTLDDSLEFLFSTHINTEIIFGGGYHLLVEEGGTGLRIIDVETGTDVVSSILLPENVMVNGMFYDPYTDYYILATTYRDWDQDRMFSLITLYILNRNGEIVRTAETSVQTMTFWHYARISVKVELDGSGYAIVHGEDAERNHITERVYYR